MALEVSQVRKLVQNRLADVKNAAAVRRELVAAAEREYALFLPSVATPVFNAVAQALSAEGYPYRVTSPGSGLRMTAERSSRTYLDLRLDTSTQIPSVVIEVSRERGHRVLVDERPLGASGRTVGSLTDEDVAAGLVAAISDLIDR
jgi:hypothetical protein